jgi:hypothetical protein
MHALASACLSSRGGFSTMVPSKEDPGAKRGPGSLAGWVRGWGLGGTPPGAVHSTLGRRGRFLRAKLFSDCPPPRAPPPLRARAMRNIGRQIDVPAVGKFEISQMDAKSSLAPATALDDIASSNREPAGQIICERGHVKILLGSNNPPGTCRHQCQTSATVPRRRGVRLPISVNRCGQGVPARNRAARICHATPRLGDALRRG